MSRDVPTTQPLCPPTRWSLIERVLTESPGSCRSHLAELLAIYEPAMRAYLISRMHLSSDEAKDALQGFVADRILAQGVIARADRNAGKFRTFVLTALRRYVIDQWRRERSAKRAPLEGQVFPLDDESDRAASEETSSDVFDVEWARGVLTETLKRMKAECGRTGQTRTLGVFECRLLDPIRDSVQPPAYEQLVERFDFESPIQASNALTTAKRIYERMLRSVISEYSRGEAEVEDEIRDLRRVLSKASAGSARD